VFLDVCKLATQAEQPTTHKTTNAFVCFSILRTEGRLPLWKG
jgi:hypothetical protein